MEIRHFYPVRCCCQPQKILGFYGCTETPIHGDKRRVRLYPEGIPFVEMMPHDLIETLRVDKEVVEIEFKEFYSQRARIREIAVYGDDRGIEFWRRVPGFVEAAEYVQTQTARIGR